MIKLYKKYVESKRLANIQAKIQIVKDLDKLLFLSKRFNLTEYLFTQEQLKRNDELWAEENSSVKLQKALGELKEEFAAAEIEITDNVKKAKTLKKGLRSVGITK